MKTPNANVLRISFTQSTRGILFFFGSFLTADSRASLIHSSTACGSAEWPLLEEYTFTPDGAPVWYTTGVSNVYNNSWSATLYLSTWNGSSKVLTPVGSLGLKLMSRSSAAFSYTVNGVSGNEPYTYQAGGLDRTGAWYEPAVSGWGLNLQEHSGFYGAKVAFFEGSQPRWAEGSTTPGPSVSMNLNWMSGPGLCPGCTYVGPPSALPVGSLSIQISSYSTSGWTKMNITTPSGAGWGLPWVNVAKLTL